MIVLIKLKVNLYFCKVNSLQNSLTEIDDHESLFFI